MVSIAQLQNLLAADPYQELCCEINLDLYDSPAMKSLATQAAVGRQLRVTDPLHGIDPQGAIAVELCEDNYPGWIAAENLKYLIPATEAYLPILLKQADIAPHLPQAIAFTQSAMRQPNTYLWGGTVGPNYDCSGLMQAAFIAQGVWLPRDAYQQEAFVQTIDLDDAAPGDLVFFGSPERCTHEGLYLGDRHYIHSSGKSQGRNGIGIDILSDEGDIVSQRYWAQFRSIGRITQSYRAKSHGKGTKSL
ncbi:MAG: C40 family peptidase [Cyanobacteria bacterium J06638_22]